MDGIRRARRVKASQIGTFNAVASAIGGLINSSIKAVEGLANSIIQALNRVIQGMNAINPFGKIKSIGAISLPTVSIPVISAATGFNGMLNQDKIFQAHKGEQVSITPPSKSGRSGNMTVIINVARSISSETDFFKKIDEHLRRSYKRSRFDV